MGSTKQIPKIKTALSFLYTFIREDTLTLKAIMTGQT